MVVKEARHKAEAKTTHLDVERMSLFLELGATKDEVSSLYSQVGRDKKLLRKTTRRPWSGFLPMATNVVCSNTTFVKTN